MPISQLMVMSQPQSLALSTALTATMSHSDNAVEMLIMPDNQYATISQEHGNGSASNANLATPGNLDIFKLHPPSADGSAGTPVGSLSFGYNIARKAVSHDCRHVYLTSERYTADGARLSTSLPCTELKPGFISAVDLYQLVSDPSTAQHNDVFLWAMRRTVSQLHPMGRRYGLRLWRVMH